MTSKVTAIEGPLAIFKCPHCAEWSPFLLIRKGVRYGFIAWGEEFHAACEKCRYDVRLEKELAAHYRELVGIMKSDLGAAEKDAQVWALATDLDLHALLELRNRGNEWDCTCGEKNPMTFPACWQCRRPAPQDVLASMAAPPGA